VSKSVPRHINIAFFIIMRCYGGGWWGRKTKEQSHHALDGLLSFFCNRFLLLVWILCNRAVKKWDESAFQRAQWNILWLVKIISYHQKSTVIISHQMQILIGRAANNWVKRIWCEFIAILLLLMFCFFAFGIDAIAEHIINITSLSLCNDLVSWC